MLETVPDSVEEIDCVPEIDCTEETLLPVLTEPVAEVSMAETPELEATDVREDPLVTIRAVE